MLLILKGHLSHALHFFLSYWAKGFHLVYAELEVVRALIASPNEC